MIRPFLLFCIFLVVGSVLVYQIQQGSGYFLLVWGNTSIEMSLWFGLIVLLLSACLLLLLLYFLRSFLRGVSSVKQKMVSYSSDKAQQQTLSGLVNFIEGDWLRAYKKLIRSASKAPAPMINYLAAARCAYETGNEQDALRLLHEAEKSEKNGHLAIALTQARMQLANQQFEKALATLERADTLKPNHHVVLSLKQQLYVELKDWSSLQELLPKLHQHNIGSVKERYYLEQSLYRALLKETMSQYADSNGEEKQQALSKTWQAIPKHFHKDSELLTLYIGELMRLRQHDLAETLLSRHLKHQWSDQWVVLYGLLNVTQPEKQLATAEAWLKQHGGSAALYLTLGRLCLQNKQWGRAKDFFESSLQAAPTPETYAECARLENFLGDQEKSYQACRKGLLVSIKQLSVVADFEK